MSQQATQVIEQDTTTTTPETTEVNLDTSIQTDTETPSETKDTVTDDLSSKPSKEAGITKKETEELPAEQEPKESFKPNYEGMIQGFIDGDLTDEDYEVIEKSGLTKEQFDLMAEGYKAKQEANTQKLYNFAGGEQQYAELQEFGAEHLSEEDIQAFNSAINSGKENLTKMAVLGLKALYQEKHGNKPQMRIEADGSSSTSDSGKFETQGELIKALNDRRYNRDPEYTQSVNQKRNRSGF